MFANGVILPRVAHVGTARFRRFMVNIIPWKDLHRLRDMSDYMWGEAVRIFESKRCAMNQADEVVSRQGEKDIIGILSKLLAVLSTKQVLLLLRSAREPESLGRRSSS